MKGVQTQQRKHYDEDDDGPPSPPRPSSKGSVVSMDSLLALAKQAENKFNKQNDVGKSKGSNNNKHTTEAQKPSQQQQQQQQQNKKRKLSDEDHDRSHPQQQQPSIDGGDNKKKKKKRKKNKTEGKVNPNDSNDVNSDDGESEEKGEEGDDEDRNDYPYPVDGDDHCESPLEAYQDIKHLLDLYSQQVVHKAPEDFAIYDPYFCEGSVIKRLTAAGYPNVYNRKEDFYQAIRLNATPQHDLLLTNPPYSSNHMEKLVRFVANENGGRPYCLLVPNYVYMKDYYQKILGNNSNVFYIVPKKRYLYTTPKGRRQQKSAKVTSPFPTFWYCGNFKSDLINKLANHVRDLGSNCTFTLARNASMIPLEAAPDNDPRKKKLRNNLKRKKNKDKKKQQNQS